MHEYTLSEIWSIRTSNETFYYPGEYINSMSLCTINFGNNSRCDEGTIKPILMADGVHFVPPFFILLSV